MYVQIHIYMYMSSREEDLLLLSARKFELVLFGFLGVPQLLQSPHFCQERGGRGVVIHSLETTGVVQ